MSRRLPKAFVKSGLRYRANYNDLRSLEEGFRDDSDEEDDNAHRSAR